MDRKNKIKLLAGLTAVVLCGILYLFTGAGQEAETLVTEGFSDGSGQTAAAGSADKNAMASREKQEEKIYIHVCGEVKKPGVYIFSIKPRVIDVVKKAGGFSKKADRSSINLAEEVSDGTQLVIPSKKRKKAGNPAADLTGKSADGKVNLNTAVKEELMTLSGIGESKAAQILSYREEHGPFQTIDEIMNISGIKEGIFNRIKNQIVV